MIFENMIKIFYLLLQDVKKYNKKSCFLPMCLIILMFISCVSTEKHVVNRKLSLSDVCEKIAYQIKSKYDITGRNIQISPNNFWELNTRINLPFSTILSDILSSKFSKHGANITLQETGLKPLKIIGHYQETEKDVIISVKLRVMGDTSSTDFAVVQERLLNNQINIRWFKPKFDRIARTLVRLLEDNYSGISSLKIYINKFVPAVSSQPELVLGAGMNKYIKDALASASFFQSSGNSLSNANAILKGDYEIMDSKMVFHASVENSHTGKNLTGTSFEIPLKNIPKELLKPKIHSLDNLVDTMAYSIIDKYVQSSFVKQKQSIIYIGKKSFYDTSLKAVIPLSLYLAEKFKEIFSNNSRFMVTDTPSVASDLILSGRIYKDGDLLVVGAGLDKIVAGKKGVHLKNIAYEQEKLSGKFCKNSWFDVDLQGRIDYLMHSLEQKSISFVPVGKRPEIVINRFKYQNSKQYSKLSDYLEGYMLDYFAASRYFSPVKDIGKRLSSIKKKKLRYIVPVGNKKTTVAVLANASYFIDGSFWPGNNGNIEIKAVLSSVKGQILASEHIKISKNKINPQWIETSQNTNFTNNLNLFSNSDSQLFIELLTQKGKNNLSFTFGEEIIFLVKANKNVYFKLYTVGADKKIYRIYPNEFTKNNAIIRAGEVVAIPDNKYSSDFSFQVRGITGDEMVFVVASDKPLPDLPYSEDIDFYGMRQIKSNVKGVKQWFSDYALKRGIFLSWDFLPVKTYR